MTHRFWILVATLAAQPSAVAAERFSAVHIVTESNRCEGEPCTRLTALGAPSAGDYLYFSSSNFDPPGSVGVGFDSSIGHVTFGDPPNQTDYLYGALAEMPLGAAFNLYAARTNSLCLFVHQSSDANTDGNATVVDWVAINGAPDARLQVAQYTLAPVEIGLYYDFDSETWAIVREDGSAMPPFHPFHLFQSNCSFDPESTATSLQTCGAFAQCPIDGLAEGDPNARLLVTHRTDSAGPILNPHPIGVDYSVTLQKWVIFNQDFTLLPEGVQFDVAEILVLLQDDFESGDFVAWSSVTP